MDTLSTIAVVGFVLGCIVVIWLISTYNSLVNLNGQVKRAWANVDVVLKQRWDLVPNLVETVKGYARHEQEVFARIAELRAQALGAPNRKQRINAEQEMDRLMPRVVAWLEEYPMLRASTNFLHLQAELSRLEEQIADRRELYNEAATHYNVYRASFPALLLAQSLGSEEAPLFEVAAQEREAPRVKF
jgi:LemA protein